LRRGRGQELQNAYTAALANYEELQSLGQARGDANMELAALQARATVYALPTAAHDLTQGWELAQQALALARQLGDRGAEARVLWNFQLLVMYSGRMAEAIPYGEQAAALAGELGLHELQAHALQDLSLAYMGVGRLAPARAVLDESAQLWRALGNRPMLAENFANSVFERLLTGHFDEGVAQAGASLQLSRSVRNQWGEVNSRVFVGMIHLARGDLDQAQEVVDSLIGNGDRVGHPAAILGRVQQAWLYASVGDVAREGEAWRAALAASTRFLPFRPLVQAAYARFLLERGELAAAEQVLAAGANPAMRKTLFIIELEYQLAAAEITAAHGQAPAAIDQLEALVVLLGETGASYYLPEAWQVKAGLLRGQGRQDEARAALVQAEAAARTLGARRRLWTLLTDLGDLEEQGGAIASARAHLAEAAILVREIAAGLSAAELRSSLLSSPQAQRALASLARSEQQMDR
jgi:tetratricopeptide (TPR) repeat protein